MSTAGAAVAPEMPPITCTETLAARPAEAYRLTFGGGDAPLTEGCALPWGRHGLYFEQVPPGSELRPDGSSLAGSVLPDLGLPLRVFGSESTVFHHPMRLGERCSMTANLATVRDRPRAQGRMALVTTREAIHSPAGLALETERITIFMGRSAHGAPPSPKRVSGQEPDWEEPRTLDAVDLFRFSALTLNAHRAHFDHAWTTEHEGYPALLVHGPLTAMLLLDFALRQLGGARPSRYEVRAVAPLFVDELFHLMGRPVAGGADLWVEGGAGRLVLQARLEVHEA
jgi:3-methylfumaryl-CoA hydratase